MSDIDDQLAEINKIIDEAKTSLPEKYKTIEGNMPQSQGTQNDNWWSVTDAMTISSALLLFFLIVLCLATYLIKLGRNPEMVMKFFGTILIISVASFLVVAGYDDKQIAPVIGLLGTIAGYLLGKDSSNRESTRSDE